VLSSKSTRNTITAILVALCCATAALAQDKDKIVGGPYAVNVTRTSATIAWIVQTAQASLGLAPDKLDKTAPALRTEKVSYTGLEPGKTFYYDVLDGRPEGKGSFRTAPNGDPPFEFVVYGDTRTRHNVHRKIIVTMLAHSSPEFALQTGDLVENGMDSAQWPVYFDIEREWLRKISFFPLVGNHERNDHMFFDFFDAKPYYAFDWGGSHFMVIDSDIATASKISAGSAAFWAEETHWLEEELKNSQNANMRFVVAHHVPISAMSTRAPEAHMVALMPMLEKYKVTAGFFGHDHNYQHYLKNGVHYVICGSGAPLYNVDRPPAGITQKVAMIENFLVVKASGKTAHLDAIDINGAVIESFDMAGQ
jgi:3',5'-cyclic AMP phosphodiesterase CpdA